MLEFLGMDLTIQWNIAIWTDKRKLVMNKLDAFGAGKHQKYSEFRGAKIKTTFMDLPFLKYLLVSRFWKL